MLRTRGIYLALATFALGQIVKAVILNLEFIGGAAGYPVAAFIRLPVVLGFALAVVIVLVWLLFGTRFGLAIRAVHDDERVADLMGVEVTRLPGLRPSRSAPRSPASAARSTRIISASSKRSISTSR